MDSKVDYQALLKDKKHSWQVSNPPAEPSVIRQLRREALLDRHPLVGPEVGNVSPASE